MDQAIWLSRAIHRVDEDRRRQELMQMLLDPASAAAAAASFMTPNLRNPNIDRETDSNPGPATTKSNSHLILGGNGVSQHSSSNSSHSNSSLPKRRKLSRHSEHGGINGTSNVKLIGSQPAGLGSNLQTTPAPTRPPPLTLGKIGKIQWCCPSGQTIQIVSV